MERIENRCGPYDLGESGRKATAHIHGWEGRSWRYRRGSPFLAGPTGVLSSLALSRSSRRKCSRWRGRSRLGAGAPDDQDEILDDESNVHRAGIAFPVLMGPEDFIAMRRFAMGKRIIERRNTMKRGFYLIGLAPLLLAGCATEPIVTTTTTEVRREVVQTQGDRVVGRQVIVTREPPAVQVETQTASPGRQYVWTRGYWRWTGTDYVWVPGNWVARPRATAVWVEGQWQRRPGGWVWVAGHWE
jgi:hypothetical protein